MGIPAERTLSDSDVTTATSRCCKSDEFTVLLANDDRVDILPELEDALSELKGLSLRLTKATAELEVELASPPPVKARMLFIAS